MHNVEITGLTRIARAKENSGGSTFLAYFDCDVAGFRMLGCAFVRTAKNGLVVWPPKLDGPESRRRSVTILDDSIRHSMMLEARETYRKLGGTDAEWIGRSIPEGSRSATDWGTDLDTPIMRPPPVRRIVGASVEGWPLERAEPEDVDRSGVARFLGKSDE